MGAFAYLWFRAHRAIERGRGYPCESRANATTLVVRRRRALRAEADGEGSGAGRRRVALALLVVLVAAFQTLRSGMTLAALAQLRAATTELKCAFTCPLPSSKPSTSAESAQTYVVSACCSLGKLGLGDAEATLLANVLPDQPNLLHLTCGPLSSPPRAHRLVRLLTGFVCLCTMFPARSLMGNNIGDAGATSLAYALMQSEVTKLE